MTVNSFTLTKVITLPRTKSYISSDYLYLCVMGVRSFNVYIP